MNTAEFGSNIARFNGIGTPIGLHTPVLAEIAAAGHAVSDPAYPPGSKPA